MGGAAGGGKSWWLAYEGVKHVDVPGYQGAFFRRTYPELRGAGSIWEESQIMYPHLGGVATLSPLEWRFGTPRTLLQFQHMQHEKSTEAHKSKQYAFIGLDELTDFTELQFWKLWSRCRTTCGIKPRLRASCNPDPMSWVKKLLGWWIGKDGYPIQARAGVVRWFMRRGRELQWFDHPVPGGISITFVPSKVTDNLALMRMDPEYISKLDSLPPAERARFREGNWNEVEGKGIMFQRGWFIQTPATDIEARITGLPVSRDWVHQIRMWDFAATPAQDDLIPDVVRPAGFVAHPPESAATPNWTACVKLSMTRDARYIRIDGFEQYRDSPGAWRQLVERRALQDGPTCVVGWWQDPGQAGEDQADSLSKDLKTAGVRARLWIERAVLSKETYALSPSRDAYKGRFLVDKKAEWWPLLAQLLESFPSDDAPKDAIDALSGAYLYLDRDAPGVAKAESLKGEQKPLTHPLPRPRSHKRATLGTI